MNTVETGGEYARYVAGQYACSIADHPDHECEGVIEAHHVVFRSQGGKDASNVAPLCTKAHTGSPLSVHGLGSTEAFKAQWGVDLTEVAADLWALRPAHFIASEEPTDE